MGTGTELIERRESLFGGIATSGLLPELQGRAASLAGSHSFPTTKDEEWKYTPVKALQEVSWRADTASTDAAALMQYLFPASGEVVFVFVNGRYSKELSFEVSSGRTPAGVDVRAFSCAVDSDPAALEAHIGRVASLEPKFFEVTAHLGKLEKSVPGYFGLLNTATFVDGCIIRIEKDAKIEQPIHILHVNTGETSYAAPRLFIHAGAGSQSTVIESYVSTGPRGFTNVVSEVEIEPNASLEHIKLQREHDTSTHIAYADVLQRSDSSYLSYNITFGGLLTRNDLNVFLDGSSIHSRLDGVIALNGEQHCDNHTRLDHAKPHCDSFEVYKHVLADRSTAVFNGKIFVHEDAQKTDAKQTNQALLLSPHATMNTKPQLEIFADDVKCTHGATIGQLEQGPLFYLRSRGIPVAEAKALLVYAFAAEVLDRVSNDAVRTELERTLFDKLGKTR